MARPKGSKNKKEIKETKEPDFTETEKVDDIETPEVEETKQEVSFDDIPVIKKDKEDVESKKELASFLKECNKIFDEGSICLANEVVDMEKLSTRILLLDILTKGGIPRSQIVLFYGDESSGKTAALLRFASVFTKQKIPVLLIDAEHAFDKVWTEKLGNDLDYFHVAQPDSLEKGINLAESAIASKQFGLVIYDSITAAVPREVLDKDAFQQQMGIQARANAKLMAKVTSRLQPANLKDPESYNKTIFAMVAHVREKIGVMYGNPETIPGGRAIRHHASYIFKLRKGAIIEKDKKPIGRETRIKVEKAKFSPPLVQGVVQFFFDPPRYNNAETLIVYGAQLGFIKQAGAYYSYGDIKAQGKKGILAELKKHPDKLKELKENIMASF